MEPHFWHARWQKNEIGFHERNGSQLLKDHIGSLKLSKGARIFLPLCGKTNDIPWLLSEGYNVVGVELSERAVLHLLETLGLEPTLTKNTDKQCNGLVHYHARTEGGYTVDIYQGDFFNLTTQLLGKVDATFDRAALVALPLYMRVKYGAHLMKITCSSKQLIVCFEYADDLITGPPHSVLGDELSKHYQHVYQIERLYYGPVVGGFRSQSEVFETVYLLTKKKT